MRCLGVFLLAGVLASFNCSAAAGEIQVFYNLRPPYFVETADGLEGLTAERTTAIFQEAGVPFRWVKLPSNRQLKYVRRNAAPVCAAGWFKNAQREVYARYTDPIYQDYPAVVIARADDVAVAAHKTAVSLLRDPALRLLVKDGYSYGPYLDAQIAAAGRRANKVTTTGENLKMALMIADFRADYMFSSKEEGRLLVSLAELAQYYLTLVDMEDMPPGEKRYILCSRKVPQATIDKLNDAIAETVQGIPQ